MQPVETPLDSVVSQFWRAPDEALFSQTALTAITGLTAPFFERARWSGSGGPRYLKLGARVRYRKSDVLAWIKDRPTVKSTTEAAEIYGPQGGSPKGSRKKRDQAQAPGKRRRKGQTIAPAAA